MRPDLKLLTPRSFDEALSEIYDMQARAIVDVGNSRNQLHFAANDRKIYVNGRPRWRMDDAAAHLATVGIIENGVPDSNDHSYAVRSMKKFDAATQQLASATQEISVWESAYRARGGWSRFFLVEGAGGHIHSSMSCSTCRPTTRFGWLPSVSGKTEVEAVSEHGARLCTVCFPSAPVEWTNHYELEEKAKLAEYCSGSGKSQWKPGTLELHRNRNRHGVCSACDQWVLATSLNKARKHKTAK